MLRSIPVSKGSSRKKPVCQKCGHLMAGHKRPYGIPVCPRDSSVPAECLPVSDDDNDNDNRVPTLADSSTRSRSIPDFTFDPSSSGYWHRPNPNWVDRDPPQPNPFQEIPERSGSWVSTEPASGSRASPARPQRRAFPGRPRHTEVINVDGHEESDEEDGTQSTDDFDFVPDNTSDTQSNVSTTSSSTIMKRVSRGLSLVLGQSTPLASLYSSPRDDVTAIASAAQDEGLYTRVVHLDHRVKTEPLTPTRTTPTRDHSWWIAVGRDRNAVDAIVDAQTPRKPVRRGDTIVLDPTGSRAASAEAGEPYDFARGLSTERNERIGTFPEDPHKVRNTFVDTLVAGAVGGLVVFYCLSSL
ncbi:hypothetical protein OH76DRAFT_1453568 [Lentinus brumalis]|uniref:Uncharacterized protein n=1 Tax=Lentinus brumalis TaxID=2498619 RepID=A0A371DMP7_9APHY|nr:hypothetical protein OH76DRAFT_1453568 [Polyporus brumalis]